MEVLEQAQRIERKESLYVGSARNELSDVMEHMIDVAYEGTYETGKECTEDEKLVRQAFRELLMDFDWLLVMAPRDLAR